MENILYGILGVLEYNHANYQESLLCSSHF